MGPSLSSLKGKGFMETCRKFTNNNKNNNSVLLKFLFSIISIF